MNGAPLTIFIADDDPDDLLIMSDSIREARPSATIICCESGQLLLEQLESFSSNGLPALVVLDLNMPGKDGRSTLAAIKMHIALKFVPVVICTTSTSTKDKIDCYATGANCFVSKPNSFREFGILFASILDLWVPLPETNY